jgi:hypothetical protein
MVLRGPQRICCERSAGCDEIALAGTRSRGASPSGEEAAMGVEGVERSGERGDGRRDVASVGRRRGRDVNVL